MLDLNLYGKEKECRTRNNIIMSLFVRVHKKNNNYNVKVLSPIKKWKYKHKNIKQGHYKAELCDNVGVNYLIINNQ